MSVRTAYLLGTGSGAILLLSLLAGIAGLIRELVHDLAPDLWR